MAEERPPSWVPVDQHVGQVPLAITQDVDATHVAPQSPQNVHKLATQIVRENQPLINRFVAVQRQQVELGEKDLHKSTLPLRDMTVYYQNVDGLERMHYHIKPKFEEPPEAPAQPSEVEAPAPPRPETLPETPKIETREPEVPEPDKPPEFEEPKPPEPPEPPEEKWEPEEEKKELKAPEFLQIDIPCFLAVTFGDGAGDPPKKE